MKKLCNSRSTHWKSRNPFEDPSGSQIEAESLREKELFLSQVTKGNKKKSGTTSSSEQKEGDGNGNPSVKASLFTAKKKMITGGIAHDKKLKTVGLRVWVSSTRL